MKHSAAALGRREGRRKPLVLPIASAKIWRSVPNAIASNPLRRYTLLNKRDGQRMKTHCQLPITDYPSLKIPDAVPGFFCLGRSAF